MSRPILAGCVALLTLSGCSLGADTEPRPVEHAPQGAAREVIATVGRLQRAVASRDWRTVCDRLFTPGARRRTGGFDCPRRLNSYAQGLRRPRIRLLSLRLSGDRAIVRVSSRAVDQPPIGDQIELLRIGRAFRIEAID